MKICANFLGYFLLLSGIENVRADDKTLIVSVDVFASETGYYVFENVDENGDLLYPGPSPDLHVNIGETIVFDQGAGSNWYHPVGFAYYPDGAHGETWGGEERAEVEGAGELIYKKDGVAMECGDDTGDTALDCYEPEFFYPRDVWKDSGDYSAELTITDDVADASIGGVIYYFCHIHSKMSGKIIIDDIYNPAEEMPLYDLDVKTTADTVCGTAGLYDSFLSWKETFVCGELDTTFEKCLQTMDYKMSAEMTTFSSPYSDDPIALFCEQMIPHHTNAVNMAKAVLKLFDFGSLNDEEAEDEWKQILYTIINAQNYEIHQFQNYLSDNPYERCDDYPNTFRSDNTRNQECVEVAQLDPSSYTEADKQFCPNTTGTCRGTCGDTAQPFPKKNGYSKNKYSCSDIKKMSRKKKNEECKERAVKFVCPQTCQISGC